MEKARIETAGTDRATNQPVGVGEEQVYRNRIADKLPKRKAFRLIDTFSGAGGMTLGFVHKEYGLTSAPGFRNLGGCVITLTPPPPFS